MAAAGYQTVEQLAAAALQLTSLIQPKPQQQQHDGQPPAATAAAAVQEEGAEEAAPQSPNDAEEDSDDGLDLYADLLQPLGVTEAVGPSFTVQPFSTACMHVRHQAGGDSSLLNCCLLMQVALARAAACLCSSNRSSYNR